MWIPYRAITPEDLIIYRKDKDNGKDISMVIARLLVAISLIFTVYDIISL